MVPLSWLAQVGLGLLITTPSPQLTSQLSRRATLSTAAAALAAVAAPAYARPEGVNKPELLPKEQTNVIDLQRFLTTGEAKALDKQLTKLQEATGIKLRVLCQQYVRTAPGTSPCATMHSRPSHARMPKPYADAWIRARTGLFAA